MSEIDPKAEIAVAPPPEPPRRCWGWPAIAAELDVSVRTAKSHADRDRDPLPVEHGHRGVWAYATAIRDWIRRQNVPYTVHLRMLRVLEKQAEQDRQQRKKKASRQTQSARDALADKRERAA